MAKPKPTPNEPDTATLRALAVQHGLDPRTVLKAIRGEKLKGAKTQADAAKAVADWKQIKKGRPQTMSKHALKYPNKTGTRDPKAKPTAQVGDVFEWLSRPNLRDRITEVGDGWVRWERTTTDAKGRTYLPGFFKARKLIERDGKAVQ